MKNIGMTKKIDGMGRIVLPSDWLTQLDLAQGDAVQFMFSDDHNSLILKKNVPVCCSCESTEALSTLPDGQAICETCMKH